MTAEDVGAWLTAQGVADKVQTDGYVPTQPDRLVLVNLTGGPGERRERSFDVISVQVLARGKQRDQADAKVLADQIDDIFMGAARPSIGGTYVASISRSGGPPAFVAREGNSGRVTYGCSYLLEIARSVH